MSSVLAPEALQGFSNASNYDKYRPTYPEEAVSKLLARLGVAGVAGAQIIDVGAGTGKFTSLLADREEKFEIKCIEPHNEMKEVLAKKFGEGNEGKWKGGVQIVEGDAANMSVEDEWADAVIASQV
jgi:ubiquinone/menaquinone biosynthesis C-methylase UbiE